jgi:RNA polymerase-binding transcription factor DksA
MATYKYLTYLAERPDDIFDDAYRQGNIIFHSGIYQCFECGAEIALPERKVFPTCGLCVPGGQDRTLWRLLVRADR